MTTASVVFPVRRRADYWWVAVLLAVLVQIGALFYWGGRISQRLDTVGESVRDHEVRLRLVESRP